MQMSFSKSARDPYHPSDLDRLINPRSIAVVGASETPGSFGARTVANIMIGFTGDLYPVNLRSETVFGLKCYPDLETLPDVPDCVVLIVPSNQVEALIQVAASLGVGGVVIYSAGFAEVGTQEQIATQARLVDIACRYNIRLLGPNCVGIANIKGRYGLNFMPKFDEMPLIPGSIGLVSQSGALGYCVLQAMERGIGFSYYLSPGNSCDVDSSDLINFLVGDKDTKVIACMFEGVSDGSRFLAAAANALRAGKPLLVYKLANTEIGRRTALSHTGTVAGSIAAYKAAFRRCGIVEIDSWEELLEAAVFFSKSNKPLASGVGVMASSGGAAVMAADKASEFSIHLPPPDRETKIRLEEVVPNFGSTQNPCDLTAESLRNVEMYGHCIRAFADDPNYAAVIVPMMSAQKPNTVDRAEYLSNLATHLGKPICLVWINEWLEGPGSEIYDRSSSISMFRSMSRCMKTLSRWFDYFYSRDERLTALDAGSRPHELLGSELLSNFDRKYLSESESKRILKAFGVPIVQERLVNTPGGAIAAADQIGYPVVLKIDSEDIPHKTDFGVIRLNLLNRFEVEVAASDLLAAVGRMQNSPRIRGILVQQMVRGGFEMFVGARVDNQFGPTVTCGFGGIAMEVDPDVTTELAPVTPAIAKAMIGRLRKRRLIEGFRGNDPMDVSSFAQAIVSVSHLIVALSDKVSEVDVNPFIMTERFGVAVDGLLVTRER